MSKGRSRSRTGIHAAVASIAIAAGLGAAGVAGARGTAAEHVLNAASLPTWTPSNNITIRTGDSVRWSFETGGFHNVQSTDTAAGTWTPPIPDDNPIDDHPDVTHTFTAEGVYSFHCDAHIPDMNGTITVEDEPATPSPSPTPSPLPSGPPSTPPPATGTDTVKPTVKSVKTKALLHAVRVQFRLSEPATVTVKIKRRGSRKVLKSASVQARAGTRTVTLRSKRLEKGRYTIEIQARDAYGNRSSLAAKRLTLRK